MTPAEYVNVALMEDTHWWYVGQAGLARDWLARLPANGERQILDAGCGAGGAARWLGALGRAHGLDRHPLALELARARATPRLARGDVRALPYRAARFDLVTSFEVLCQLPDDDDTAALREIARVLRPGGWLLVRLPAHDWLRGAHDRYVHTHHRYTANELRDKLLAAGLWPVRVTYVNALLGLPAIAWRLATRRAAAATDVRPLPAWLNTALTAVLRLETAWLRRWNLPGGLSLLALARKGPI